MSVQEITEVAVPAGAELPSPESRINEIENKMLQGVFACRSTEAVEAARTASKTNWLTPKFIYKGAARVGYRTKLQNLRSDAHTDATALERLFVDLTTFCLQEKRKTAFLISQYEVRTHRETHDAIKQLMQLKIITAY